MQPAGAMDAASWSDAMRTQASPPAPFRDAMRTQASYSKAPPPPAPFSDAPHPPSNLPQLELAAHLGVEYVLQSWAPGDAGEMQGRCRGAGMQEACEMHAACTWDAWGLQGLCIAWSTFASFGMAWSTFASFGMAWSTCIDAPSSAERHASSLMLWIRVRERRK